MKSAALSLDALQAAVDHLPDSALMSSRRAALAHLREHGLPTTRDEDWKYTDLSAVVDISNRSLTETDSMSPSTEAQALIASIHDAIEAEWLVVFNGQIDSRFLDKFDQDGVRVSRLSDSAEDIAPLASSSWMKQSMHPECRKPALRSNLNLAAARRLLNTMPRQAPPTTTVTP
jgi:hypothetical protein